MIKSISISNFKGLENFKINELGQINLLGGKNNAGKSTILEAIFFYHDRLNPANVMRNYSWRGMNNVALRKETFFLPLFYNYDINNEIVIDIEEEKSQHSILKVKYLNDIHAGSKKINFKDLENNDNIPNLNDMGSLQISAKKGNEILQDSTLQVDNEGINLNVIQARSVDKKVRYISAKSIENTNELAIMYSEIDVRGETDEIINILRIIEPRLNSLSTITLEPNMSMVYADIELKQKVPINFMGDGLNRVLNILLSIVSMKNGIVMIDEIENGIHYSILPTVWKMILEFSKQYECQIFATTHSYECLSSAVEGIFAEDDFKYFRIEKDSNSNILSKAFSYESLETSILNGWEIR